MRTVVCTQKSPGHARAPSFERDALEALFDLHDLTATIHTGLQIDMVRAMQFACGLVLDISIAFQRVMCAAHVALGARDFGLWNGHRSSLSSRLEFPEPAGLGRLLERPHEPERLCRRKPRSCQPSAMTARRPDLTELSLSRSREVMNINLDINFLFTSSS